VAQHLRRRKNYTGGRLRMNTKPIAIRELDEGFYSALERDELKKVGAPRERADPTTEVRPCTPSNYQK